MHSSSTTPSLVVDYRKNRIRIHRSTLGELGKPRFIRLLVNPIERSLAVQVCDANDSTAHRVPASLFCGKRCFEIYSRSLMQELLLCSNWSNDAVYRMYASACLDENFLVFKIDDSVALMPSSSDAYAEGVNNHET